MGKKEREELYDKYRLNPRMNYNNDSQLWYPVVAFFVMMGIIISIAYFLGMIR